jgi:multidrug resistance efflux pump
VTARRIIIIVVIIAIIAIAAFLIFGGSGVLPTNQTDEPVPTIPPVQDLSGDVNSEGRLIPARDVNLSFATGGTSEEILVSEDSLVAEGDPLLRLEASSQESALQQAEAGLAAAEAQLESALSRLAVAEAAVTTAELGSLAAEANQALVNAGAMPEEVAAAENEIEAARAGVTQASAGRDATLEIPESEIRAAEADVAAARAELEALQDRYDTIIETCFDLPTGDTICPLYGTVEENTRAQLETARLNLESAQAALDSLNAGATAGQRQAASGSVTVALANQDLAEAQLDLLLAGPSSEEVRQAEVQVEQAQVGVEQAQVAVEQARAAVTQAEAGVAVAQGNVEAAQAALDRMTLRAVFPGIVGSVDVELGQLVSPGMPVIVLADLNDWLVETTDLTELDVARVEIGAPVEVEIDAIPGEILEGTVTDIARVFESGRGDILYRVVVDLVERPDLPLRWGMTAVVDITAE